MSVRLFTIVIPALNEAASIVRVIDSLPRDEIGALGFDTEVLVVDNGSTDGTGARAEAAGARVVHEPRPGYGSALKRGLHDARGEVVATIDADGSHPVDALPAMLAHFDATDRAFIMGTRFKRLTRRQRLALRNAGNTGLTLAARLLFGLPTTDSQSGMWMMRKTVAMEAQSLADDFAFSQEIKILAWREHRAGWEEWPIPMVDRIAGESELRPFRDGLRIGWRLLRLRVSRGPQPAAAPLASA